MISIDTRNVGVYLCQVGPEVSCGACCGLYNVADPGIEALDAMLARRTRWFEQVPRTVAGIETFKDRVMTAEPRERPFPKFHHCPYLGVIEDAGRRVGCLLHPLARGNQGIDWRGLSYYGGMACRTYFCPSVRQLPDRWLTVIRQSMDHWYLHGLILTERKLLTALFSELETCLGRPIETGDFSRPSSAQALRTFMADLKLSWPYRRSDAPGVCNYFFEDGQYVRPAEGLTNQAAARSRFDVIFQELDSGFSSPTETKGAEAKLEAMFGKLIHILMAAGNE
ncbi:MAG: hypothetical protein SWH61_09010 [Thermodesulfobacteriota bacterium]|nr:hypothetical protein [Thermodesulfobacteriota bacterium]